jgi:ABC-2 type transport system permease protein
MLRQQTQSEFLRLWRNPAFSAASLAVPLVIYAFIGLAHFATEQGVSWHAFMLASLAAYAVVSVSLFSFGVGVATERGQRMNVLMRATPLLPWVYLAAKTIAAIVFAFVALLMLFGFAALVGNTHLAAETYAVLSVRLLAGSLPFLAMGFAIGYLASPQAASAVTNVVWLTLSFASGLFVPLSQLPSWVGKVAPYLPTYRLAQLSWDAVGARTGRIGPSVLWLCAYTAVFFAVALWAYGRDAAQTFG